MKTCKDLKRGDLFQFFFESRSSMFRAFLVVDSEGYFIALRTKDVFVCLTNENDNLTIVSPDLHNKSMIHILSKNRTMEMLAANTIMVQRYEYC